MSQINDTPKGKTYWRSLDELADTPEYREMVEREFPAQAAEMIDPATRRDFLKVMGASFALAGLTACRWPKENILPFAYRAPGTLPSVTQQFATVMEIGESTHGLLVTSYDGRPIKIEGNPLHPDSLGACSSQAQASLLGLYCPDRSRQPKLGENGKDIHKDWGQFFDFANPHFQTLRESEGDGLAVLSESSSSETLKRLKARFHKVFPRASWHEYEPVSRDNEREGARLAFGKPVRTHYDFSKAKVIAAFDSDFLMEHPSALSYAKSFAKNRRAENGLMSRLWSIESAYTLTGAAADQRIAITSSQVSDVLFHLLHPPESARSDFQELYQDLREHKGESLVIAGPGQPAEVHAMCHHINERLGNIGTTVFYTEEANDISHHQSLAELVTNIDGGNVETLIMLGGNPVYNSPADSGFATALEKVNTSFHLSLYEDETSKASTWHVPKAHYLEAWGDARAYDGTWSIAQPLIEPLYGGKSALEFLNYINEGSSRSGHDLVKETFVGLLGESAWRKALHDGIVGDSAYERIQPKLDSIGISKLIPNNSEDDSKGLEVSFRPDTMVFDGRFANNGWLQETPDPMTKVAWDNVAQISIEDANVKNIRNGDLIRLKLEGREVYMPAYIMPGQAKGSITLTLGYGREASGRVGDGVGFNAYQLKGSSATNYTSGLNIENTGTTHPLAMTQDHFAIDEVGLKGTEERMGELYREAELTEYKSDPEFAKHRVHMPAPVALWKEHEYNDHKWGMAIDLSACIGCGACSLACQAENNIPVVGKEQVSKGRIMNWIRVDRYFIGPPETPQTAHQPVACHHCENAPCEQVCPVAATTHSSEGLNEMVYNRCIGTRYCSNNCPYKVRRFNFFNYQKELTETQKMAYNPDVTVRSRGVMEKCTYCVQRINSVKISAKNEGRSIKDGDIVPACAQSCPTEAIVFGDLNDEQSRVRSLHDHPRSYAMLGELNVKPRTLFLAKIRNPINSSGNQYGNGSHS